MILQILCVIDSLHIIRLYPYKVNFLPKAATDNTFILVSQVVESLLDPATVDRLKAVRRYVEDPAGDFPPQPSMSDLPVPLYGYTSEMALEWWKTRHISSISFRASDMLYSERQAKYYEQDMDLPW